MKIETKVPQETEKQPGRVALWLGDKTGFAIYLETITPKKVTALYFGPGNTVIAHSLTTRIEDVSGVTILPPGTKITLTVE